MKEILQHRYAFRWLVAATGMLLLIPFTAMQFTNEVAWTSLDFLVMGALLLSLGLSSIYLARKQHKSKFYLTATIALVVFLYVWAELAVGIFFSFGS